MYHSSIWAKAQEMRTMYAIKWYNKKFGYGDTGKYTLTKEEAESWCEGLNKDHPEIEHIVVKEGEL